MSARDREPAESFAEGPGLLPRATTAPEVSRIVAVGDDGIWISGSRPGHLRRARAIVDLDHEDVGASVLVVHEGHDESLPIILGRVREGRRQAITGLSIDADGRRLTVSATDRVTLQCGDASLTLTRSGKVLINGHYVQSRATGVNAIKGGSIELN